MAGYPVVDAGPATFRPAVTPTISGTSTPVVAINGGAAAGSRHIDDATPISSETLAEQVHWAFASTDIVKKVRVGLNVHSRRTIRRHHRARPWRLCCVVLLVMRR